MKSTRIWYHSYRSQIKESCLASMLIMLTELECDITAELHLLTLLNKRETLQNHLLTPHDDGSLKSQSLSGVPASCKRIVQPCRCASPPGKRKTEARELKGGERFRDTSTLHRLYYTSDVQRVDLQFHVMWFDQMAAVCLFAKEFNFDFFICRATK